MSAQPRSTVQIAWWYVVCSGSGGIARWYTRADRRGVVTL